MGCVENMVFQYLKEYREQANREKFILPKMEEIKLFSDTINKSVEFFKNKIYEKYFIFNLQKYLLRNPENTFRTFVFPQKFLPPIISSTHTIFV